MIETPCSPVVIFMTFSQVCGDPVKPGVRQRPAGGVKNVTFWSILTLSRGGRKRSILTPPEPRKVGVTLNQDRWNPPKFTLFSIAPPPQNGVKMTTFWPPLGGGQNRHFGCYRWTSPDSPGIDDVMLGKQWRLELVFTQSHIHVVTSPRRAQDNHNHYMKTPTRIALASTNS